MDGSLVIERFDRYVSLGRRHGCVVPPPPDTYHRRWAPPISTLALAAILDILGSEDVRCEMVSVEVQGYGPPGAQRLALQGYHS